MAASTANSIIHKIDFWKDKSRKSFTSSERQTLCSASLCDNTQGSNRLLDDQPLYTYSNADETVCMSASIVLDQLSTSPISWNS